MITVIRKHVKSMIFKVILWVFVVVLGITFLMPDKAFRASNTPWIARINGHDIDGNTFRQALVKQEANIRMLRQQYGQYAEMFMQMLGLSQNPQKAALQEVVQEELLNQVAESIPLYINRDYVDQKFNDFDFVQRSGLYMLLPLGFFNAQGVDEQALARYLSQTGIHMPEFESMVEKAVARHIALELSGLAAYSPSYVAEEALNNELSQKKYAVLTFALDAIKNELKAKGFSEQELQAHFDKHNKINKRYWMPEKRAGTLWEFDPSSYGIVIPEASVEEYYNAQKLKKYVEAPSQVQVRRVLFKTSDEEKPDVTAQRLQALRDELLVHPETFAAKAQELSQDAESASKGGLLPFFAKGARDQAFERKAFLLKNEGDLSEVFQSPEGFELVQLIAKKPTQFKSLSFVKPEIEKTLLQQAFAKDFAKDFKKIVDASGIDERALEAFTTSKKQKKTALPFLEKDSSKLATTLFRLKPGEADFYVEGDKGYIVQLHEVKPKAVPNLQDVKAIVEQDILQDRSAKTLQERLESAKNDLKLNDPAAVAQKYSASVQYTEPFDKDQKEEIEKLKAVQIPVEKMLQLGKKGSSGISIDGQKGYVFVVLDVIQPKAEADNEKRLLAVARLQHERKSLFTEGFVASLSENATIETNNSLLNLNETDTL